MNPVDSQQAMVSVATFYRFVPLPDYELLAASLRTEAESSGLLGTVILAPEGINATIAGARADLEAWLGRLCEDGRFTTLEPRWSEAGQMPFYRFKVRLRAEIVTLGAPGIRPYERTGIHVEPADWDELLDDPETVVIDTRNRYETGVGSFEGAEDPGTEAFREFPDYVNKHLDPARDRKVAMFCTGGIRCEKASAWMLAQGFSEVYQLRGGILNYLEQREAEDGRWQGDCFLFDQRVGVSYGLMRGDLEICHGCRMPLCAADREAPEFEEGVSCPACAASLSRERRASLRERHRQELLARARGARHLGNRQG